jgi:hypothetical protein
MGIFIYPVERDTRIDPRRMRENRTTRYPVFPLGMATDILENMRHPVVKALKNPYQWILIWDPFLSSSR